MCIPLMAWEVSRVFLKRTQRFEPLDLHDFVGFLGQVNSKPFSEVTSGHLQEKLDIIDIVISMLYHNTIYLIV